MTTDSGMLPAQPARGRVDWARVARVAVLALAAATAGAGCGGGEIGHPGDPGGPGDTRPVDPREGPKVAPGEPPGEFRADVRARAVAATVRVRNPADGQRGSGVVVTRAGNLVQVLTAEHVVPTARAVEVTFAPLTASGEPRQAKAEVLERSVRLDLALLLARLDDAPDPLPLMPENARPVRVVSVGWASGDVPTARDERLAGAVTLTRTGGVVRSWETEQKPAPGRSGGPLVDEGGRLAGLASGHDGAAGYYVHADAIRGFLGAPAPPRTSGAENARSP
ncbi:MAG: serine protease [Gemmataceae bacterium]|nr:serine protease [Gemmataceae bacterium]